MKLICFATAAAALLCKTALAGNCSWCGVLDLEPAGPGTTASLSDWSRGEALTNRIDLLVAYDNGALAWLEERNTDMQTFSEELLREMNEGIALTGLDEHFRFNLAKVHEFGADASGTTMDWILSFASQQFSSISLKKNFKTLRDARDAAAADITILLCRPRKGTVAGIAIPLTANLLTAKNLASYAEQACCVCDIKYARERHTVLHEVGHIFGAGHSDTEEPSPGPQLKTYSSGYNFSTPSGRWTTVMGHPSENSAAADALIRLPFFSSPDWLYEGTPVGTAGKNDNTRTLRETYALVANFRVAEYLPGWTPADDGESGGGIEDGGESGTATVKPLSISVKDADGLPVEDGETIDLVKFENTTFTIEATCLSGEKTKIKAKGLPSGLKYSSKTRKVAGMAKKAGSFDVTLTAKAKGEEDAVLKFTLKVAEFPAAAAGTYAGIVSNATEGATLATATVTTGGRTKIKLIYGGASRSFACYGFDRDAGGSSVAATAKKIKGKTHVLPVRFGERELTIDGFDGVLLQSPWGRKDVAAPVFKKTLKCTADGLDVKVSGKGRVRMSGKVDGVRASGTFQAVAGSPATGFAAGKWAVPYAFKAKRGFGGAAGWYALEITVDANGRAAGVSVKPVYPATGDGQTEKEDG